MRYNGNGSLDTTFNGTGKVTTAIGSSDDYGRSVAVQSDGRIVVAGYSYNGSKWDFALARYDVFPAPPVVTTGVATNITATGATLNGTVNADGAATTVSFEYGPDTNYGSTAAATPSPVTGTTATAVSGTISGLLSNTTYHFRVKAVSAEGTAYGADATFATLPPEIAVEQPLGTDIPDGGTKSFGTLLAGSTTSLTFTIRNTGLGNLTGLGMTKDGAQASEFTVTANPTAPVPGPSGSTTFTVQFAPVAGGLRTAAIHIANNDPDENPFDITLTGRALSTNDDTDGDGLNDAAEFQMAALGFDWQVSQPALVSTLYSNANLANLFNQTQMDANRTLGRNDVTSAPNTYSLYTLAQVQALNVNTPLLTRDAGTGKFKLTIALKKATNLTNFLPFSFTAPETTINAQGKLEFEFTVPDNAAFFRLQAQ